MVWVRSRRVVRHIQLRRVALDGDRCEVWVARTAELEAVRGGLEDILSPEERAYVEGLRATRAVATLSRGLLRLLVARYRGQAVDQVAIDRRCEVCGRPHAQPRMGVPVPTTTSELSFSVSHGGDRLVLAFSGSGPVGVDVEPTASVDEPSPSLLDFTLSASERQRFEQSAPDERRRVFLRYWTAKEACLKLVGTGLDLPPGSVVLADLPAASAHGPERALPQGSATVAVFSESPPVELSVMQLALGPDYVGSVATGRQVRHLKLTHLSPTLVQQWLRLSTGTQTGWAPATTSSTQSTSSP